MKLYKDVNELKSAQPTIDDLIYTYVFTQDKALKDFAYAEVRRLAKASGAYPASIQNLYEAAAKGAYGKKTVPAINIRGLTYDVARSVFRAAMANKVGPFVFEIARSEMRYTVQDPAEYATVVLAAAVKEKYKGPVFIQGDHFQVSSKKYAADAQTEINELKSLIKKAVDAGFYNIDIDASTLVDIHKPDINEQQKDNARITAELTEYIRGLQPAGVTVSVGGEIGEVGKQNSTPEELRAFMNQYKTFLKPGAVGISKISVQTGTAHGGVVLPDGTMAKVQLDFNTLRTLSDIGRKEFGMAGAVQHGASTLPEDFFDKFPQNDTAEVHLATGFQNMIYESSHFPKEMMAQINQHLITNEAAERKAKDSEEQFLYKTRKKAFGPFKRQMWDLPQDKVQAIMKELEAKFAFLFDKLGVVNTSELVGKYIKQ
ncbi:MAG: class II fructose-bisphosphate aldolase [Candidatus Brocadiia bacterium]